MRQRTVLGLGCSFASRIVQVVTFFFTRFKANDYFVVLPVHVLHVFVALHKLVKFLRQLHIAGIGWRRRCIGRGWRRRKIFHLFHHWFGRSRWFWRAVFLNVLRRCRNRHRYRKACNKNAFLHKRGFRKTGMQRRSSSINFLPQIFRPTDERVTVCLNGIFFVGRLQCSY